MKKLFVALFALVAFFGVMNVKAMSESELKTKMANGYIVDGKAVKPSEYQLSEIERYLNKYEVSEDDSDELAELKAAIMELSPGERNIFLTYCFSTAS